MPKSTHFIGQPLYAQIVQLIDKAKVLRISQSLGGERYVKRFAAWTHLIVMLYAVINPSLTAKTSFEAFCPETRFCHETWASLLGCQHDTLWTQSAGRELLLTGDRPTYVYTEVGHDRRHQSAGRKSRNATMWQALETSDRDLPKARFTRSPLQENQNL